MRRVVTVLDGWDATGLKAIATALVEEPGVAAVLVSSASPAFVVVARSSDVAVDANKTLRQLLERFGGRGGGRPDLAQGGGLTAAPDQITAAVREILIGEI